jgi:hypothetical protein
MAGRVNSKLWLGIYSHWSVNVIDILKKKTSIQKILNQPLNAKSKEPVDFQES